LIKSPAGKIPAERKRIIWGENIKILEIQDGVLWNKLTWYRFGTSEGLL
jgi:hypothetical protein